ncbi:glycosyltransferase [Bacillus sp. BRMEA1]|nr:glycosyltransferase [Neobacillus endophyticus]
MNEPSVSLCMVVQNEEQTLEKCLTSVKGIVQEIIIVDTGSTDKTTDVAQRFGAKIITSHWNDDFSKARNLGIKEAKEEWILVLDADEELYESNFQRIKDSMNDSSIGGFFINFINFFGEYDENSYFTDSACRLFRNHPNIHFSGDIHEEVTTSIHKLGLQIIYSGLTIFHYGYLESVLARKKKNNRNLRIIRKALKKRPDDLRLKYALGVEQIQAEAYADALETFIGTLEIVTPEADFAPDILLKTVHLLRYFNRNEEALQLVESGLSHYPDFSDLYDVKADIHLIKHQYQHALNSLSACIAIKPDRTRYSTQAGSGSYRTVYCLGLVQEKLLQYKEAHQSYHTALTLNPRYLPAWRRWVLWSALSPSPQKLVEDLNAWKYQLRAEQWVILIKKLTTTRNESLVECVWELIPYPILEDLEDKIKPIAEAILLAIRGDKEQARNILQCLKRKLTMEEVLFQWSMLYETNNTQEEEKWLLAYAPIYPEIRALKNFIDQYEINAQTVNILKLATLMMLEAGFFKGYIRLQKSIPQELDHIPLSHFYLIYRSPIEFIQHITERLYPMWQRLSVIEAQALCLLLMKLGRDREAKEILMYLIEKSPMEALNRLLLSQLYISRGQKHVRHLTDDGENVDLIALSLSN